MARTESTMLPLETAAPDFALPDVSSGAIHKLGDFKDREALLVMFICQHCPVCAARAKGTGAVEQRLREEAARHSGDQQQ